MVDAQTVDAHESDETAIDGCYPITRHANPQASGHCYDTALFELTIFCLLRTHPVVGRRLIAQNKKQFHKRFATSVGLLVLRYAGAENRGRQSRGVGEVTREWRSGSDGLGKCGGHSRCA